MFGEFVGIPHNAQGKRHDRSPYQYASQDLHQSRQIDAVFNLRTTIDEDEDSSVEDRAFVVLVVVVVVLLVLFMRGTMRSSDVRMDGSEDPVAKLFFYSLGSTDGRGSCPFKNPRIARFTEDARSVSECSYWMFGSLLASVQTKATVRKLGSVDILSKNKTAHKYVLANFLPNSVCSAVASRDKY